MTLDVGGFIEHVAPPSPDNDKKDEQIAELQQRVQQLRNENLEERFLWIIGLLTVIDLAVFPHMSTLSAPLVIGALNLIVLAIFAQKCGVDAFMPLIDKISGMWPSSTKGGS